MAFSKQTKPSPSYTPVPENPGVIVYPTSQFDQVTFDQTKFDQNVPQVLEEIFTKEPLPSN